MITCPNCGASLPDWAKECQFCQVDTSGVVRPKQNMPTHGAFETPAWVLACYYVMASFITLQGFGSILSTIMGAKHGIGPFEVVAIIWYGLGAGVGIGLLLRVEWIRGVFNFICFFQVGCGLVSLVSFLMGILALGTLGVVLVGLAVLQIVEYGFMAYLVAETDKGGF